MALEELPLNRAFTLLEPGPVVLVTTSDGQRDNVMTITWTMVLDFSPTFAIKTGPWNYSYTALSKSKECVLAIPTVDLIDKVIGIGTCSGLDTAKFDAFDIARKPARNVRSPLLPDCLANIECRVLDILDPYGVVVLEGVAAWIDRDRREKRTLHAVGDGTFIVDGETIDRRTAMRSKLPDGV
ncbi:MAG: flavin reductase domain protein, FMN-binding protein [Proteobacteria bacterium]|nr:flavin reductase domain protein, FMN-binding protein [Pseudomonadota bacterium]